MSKFLRKILSGRRTKQEEQVFKNLEAYVAKLKRETEKVKAAEELLEKHKPIELTEATKTVASKTATTILPKKFSFTFRRTNPAPIATKPPLTPPEKVNQSLEADIETLKTRLDKLEQLIAALELKLNPPSRFSRLKTGIYEKTARFSKKSVPKRTTSEYKNETPKQIGWMGRMALKVANIRKPAHPPPITARTRIPDKNDKSRYAKMLPSANHKLLAKFQAMKQTVDSVKKGIAEKRPKRLFWLKAFSLIALLVILAKFF